MPFNGAGVFSRLYSWITDAANGVDISATRMDADSNDIAAALSNCMTRDGQGVPTAQINFGNQNLAAVGVLTAASLVLTGGEAIGGNITAGTGSFSGDVTAVDLNIAVAGGQARFGDGSFFATLSGSSSILAFDANDYFAYDRTANKLTTWIGGTAAISITTGAVAIAGSLTVGGSAVLTQASFNPASYAQLNGAAFTGNVSVAGSLTAGGYPVWTSGNLNPANYQPVLGYTPANRAGDTFTGAIRRDANFYLDLSGSFPVIGFDANDYILYDRSADKLKLIIGGTVVASVDSAGNLVAKGNVTANGAP